MKPQQRKLVFLSIAAIALLCALAFVLLRGPGGAGRSAAGGGELSGGSFEFDQSRYMPDDGSAPRQLIIFYSGDGLSIPEANASYDPPEGGLSALAQELLNYQRRIVRFNQQRLDASAGTEVARLGVDSEAGMLGEHPYLLLDYGGWERISDPAGEVYVGLFAQFYDHFNYSAIGSKHYPELTAEQWADYRSSAPGMELVVSAGEARSETMPVKRFVLREVRGESWGIAAIPLPDIAEMNRDGALEVIEARFDEYIEAAAAALQESACTRSILLAPGWSAAQYERLAGDLRFDVVIGAHPRAAAAAGHGALPGKGPLLLPELLPRSRQLGVCHLYWPNDEAEPDMYYLSLQQVVDAPAEPYPFRDQVKLAQAMHQEKLAEKTEAAKMQAQ